MSEKILTLIMKEYVKKLLEYMPREEYVKWSDKTLKKMFKKMIQEWPRELREFVEENWEVITG